MKFKGRLVVLAVLSLLLLFNLTAIAEEEIPSLHEVYSEYFSIGAAINNNTMKSHSDIITKHFNSITAENEMKFDHLQSTPGIYNFYRADQMVKFAKENDMKVRGHVLVWHSQTPDWVFREAGKPASKETLLRRMRDHITKVVERYKGDIYAWDVVNEAISDGEGIYRDSPWIDIIGEEFIAEAFRAAHAADPDAKLFYNDYNAVEPRKMFKIYNMLKGLVEDGVPIHGVGIQAHWDIESPSIVQIMQAIEKYSSLGLEIHITEMDISVYPWNDRRNLTEPTTEMLEKQNQRYKNIFNLFKRYSDEITSVTLWGVADDDTWKDNHPVQGRKDWPLLFDEDHQPKDAFWEVIEASK